MPRVKTKHHMLSLDNYYNIKPLMAVLKTVSNFYIENLILTGTFSLTTMLPCQSKIKNILLTHNSLYIFFNNEQHSKLLYIYQTVIGMLLSLNFVVEFWYNFDN